MLNKDIRDLVQYGMEAGLVPACEKIIQLIYCLIYFMKMIMKSQQKHVIPI